VSLLGGIESGGTNDNAAVPREISTYVMPPALGAIALARSA
jgi:hypothetical protein